LKKNISCQKKLVAYSRNKIVTESQFGKCFLIFYNGIGISGTGLLVSMLGDELLDEEEVGLFGKGGERLPAGIGREVVAVADLFAGGGGVIGIGISSGVTSDLTFW
jgi:hypothetical protein